MYLILGLGISSIAVIEKLKELKKKMIIVVNSNEINKARKYEEIVMDFKDLKYLNLSKIKYAIKSPGIPYHNKYVIHLKKNNVRVINEIELAYILSYKKGKYIAVTGSVGKSSVVSLLYELIKKKTNNVILAGNIGIPLIKNIDKINKDTLIILEVSSFQLDDLMDMRFNIAVVLNIFDNHLDVYKARRKYYLSKLSISKNQLSNDYFLTDFDNKNIAKYLDVRKLKSKVIDYKKGYNICSDNLYYNSEFIINLTKFNLEGKHNIDNLLACLSVLKILNIEADASVLERVNPLPYHLEKTIIRDITFINDSKSTCINSLKSAIETYKSKNLILLFGGYNKNLRFDLINDYEFKRCICFGKLSRELDETIKVDSKFETLELALKYAFMIASKSDVVLFSPGCASFDEFDNYKSRGEFFNNCLREYYEM